MFVVFDLDGTLALGGHRQHFLQQEPKDWESWHAACGGDLPNAPAIETLLAHYEAGHRIEVWSGRSDQSESATRAWLARHVRTRRGEPLDDRLVRMRRAGDHRPDHVVKREWLLEERARGSAPDLIYDDRDSVVAMWRAEGVTCFQVAPGAF